MSSNEGENMPLKYSVPPFGDVVFRVVENE